MDFAKLVGKAISREKCIVFKFYSEILNTRSDSVARRFYRVNPAKLAHINQLKSKVFQKQTRSQLMRISCCRTLHRQKTGKVRSNVVVLNTSECKVLSVVIFCWHASESAWPCLGHFNHMMLSGSWCCILSSFDRSVLIDSNSGLDHMVVVW